MQAPHEKISNHTGKVSAQLETEFKRLYEGGESTYSIAGKFGFDANTVCYHLKKLEVKLRSRYEAMKLGMERGRVKTPAVPHQVMPTSSKLTPEKAYILGVLAGDGFIVYHPGRQYKMYKVALETVDEEFADEFSRCLYLTYGITPSKRIIVEKHHGRKNRYHVALHCKAACEDLLRYGLFGTRRWSVPDAVKTALPDVKASYLRGFFDSEGGVSVKGYAIYLSSVCAQGVYGVSVLLADFGIPARVKQPLEKNFCLLKIQRRQSISLFAKLVGFTIKRKKEALWQLLCKYKFFKTPTSRVLELDPEILRLRGLGLKYREIAEKLNLGFRTVWRHVNERNTLRNISCPVASSCNVVVAARRGDLDGV